MQGRFHPLIVLALLPACSDDAGFAELPERSTLGEAVYQIAHDNLARGEECTAGRLEVLESRRDAFVQSFDMSLTEEMLASLPDTLATALLPHVDDGALLELADLLASRASLLVDDRHDPRREALAALLALLQAPSVLDRHQVLDLVDVLLRRDDLPDLVHALTRLGGARDRGTWITNRFLQVASAVVELAGTETGCHGLEFDRLPSTLLDPTRFDPRLDFGTPAWAVRADSRGHPKVRIDPATGALAAPFVDRDFDGEADADAHGRLVDSSGRPVHLAPFGGEGWRDATSRAVTDSGALVFDYFDAKRTGASVLLQYLGEAVAAGWHLDLVAAAAAASPEQVACPDSEDCLRYPDDDHPVADLAFAVLEDLRYDRIAALLQTWDVVTRDSPDVAERVLVSAGRILQALEDGGVRLTDPDLVGLVSEMLPLVADVYARDNTTDESTPRLLLDVIHELGDVARDFPPKLRSTIDYVTLHKEDSCSADPPDLARSQPVDFDAPRWVGDTDNRSGLAQTVELLSVVDCGSVPLTGGKTVAEVVVGTMADSSPETACGIIEVSLAFLDLAPNLGELVGVAALDLIGCPGEEVWQGLQALDGLAKSGVLEAYLPIADAFVQRGQVRTLLEVFHLLAADLRQGDLGGPESTVRRILPSLSRIAESGGIDAVFDLVDLLVTVPAVDGSGTLADVVVDSFDYLVDDTGAVRTRRGDATGTSVGLEMLRPYHALLVRLHAAGEVDHLDRAIDYVSGFLRRTREEGGELHLADRRVLTNLQNLLGLFSDTMDLSQEERDCTFDVAQDLVDAFLTSPQFATAMRMLQRYAEHPEGRRMDGLVVDLLDPQGDGLSPLLRVVTALVQLPPESVDAATLLAYVADVVEPREGEDLTAILVALDELLREDRDALVLTLARHLSDRDLTGRGVAPAEVFLDLGVDLLATSELRQCRADPDRIWTTPEVEEALGQALAFVQGEDAPLPAILALVAQYRSEAP